METSLLELDLCWVEIKGPDAGKFLNSVLTNDIRKLGPGGCYTLLLTPKGKIVADAFCYPCESWFGLVCETKLKETLLANLKKYILFGQKVEIKDQSDKWKTFGLIGPKAHATSEGLKEKEVWVILSHRWGLPYVEVWVRPENYAKLKEKVNAPALDAEAQEVLRIESGTPAFGKDFDETTIPQEAGLYHALSFDKGCYVGQEVVARLEHRGHVGKQLVQIFLESESPPKPGEKIFSKDQKEIGWITSACYSTKHKNALALGYLRYQFLDQTEGSVGGAQARFVRHVK